MKMIIFLFLLLLFQCVQAKEIVIGDKYFITTINDIYLNLDEYREITVTFEGNLERGTFDDPDFDQKKEFAFEAKTLKNEAINLLGIKNLDDIRIINIL